MPKKKVIKNKKPLSFRNKIFKSIKAFYDTRTWTKIFLTLLALWGLVWCGQVAVERYRFYDAEKKLDKLAAELQKELGDEYKLEKERSCDYSSVKYGRGHRSCSISVGAEKESISPDDANKLAYAFKQVVDNNSLFKNKKTSENELPFALKQGTDSKSMSLSYSFGLEGKDPYCGAGTGYYQPSAYEVSGSMSKPRISVSFYCFGDAKIEYFPVKD
ncbi:hypothetical protein HZB74_03910 [Candidatus Saccharibacteria bacterium]|nr:hypothetical protein [Candidatus Saccharibacteria bacterium]